MKTITMLIADDDAGVRRVLERLLSKTNCRTILAADGIAALAAAREEKPDLIILDITMPGLDGRTVCGALRCDESTRDIPILMLTGLGGIDDEIEGLHTGADDYVAKPFDSKELSSRINALLRRCYGWEMRS